MSHRSSARTHRFLAPGLVAGCLLVLLLAGCGGSTSATGNAPTATAVPAAPTATTAPTTAAATPTVTSGSQVAITIQNLAFSPQMITIKTGTTVTWTDKDSVAHTVTSTAGPASFNSGMLTPSGGTFHFTFTQAGTYSYHCMIHPFMTATIFVVS